MAAVDPALCTQLRRQLQQQLAGLVRANHDDAEPLESERDVVAELDAHTNAQIEATEAALARLEDGTFGRCADCGTSIRAERLVALPTAARCLDCQSLFESRP